MRSITQAESIRRFWAKVHKTDTCWLWTGSTFHRPPNNYGRMRRDDKTLFAHRFSYELHNGPIPSGGMVLHSCDNPLCVRPDHLRLGTHQDNMHDRTIRLRTGNRILTPELVYEIRRLRALGWTHEAVANHLQLKRGAVQHVIRGTRWAHLK